MSSHMRKISTLEGKIEKVKDEMTKVDASDYVKLGELQEKNS